MYNSVPAMYEKLVRRNYGKLVTSNKITGSEKQFTALKYQRAKAPTSFRHIALHSGKASAHRHGTTLALHRGTVLARHSGTTLTHRRSTALTHETDPPPPLHLTQKLTPETCHASTRTFSSENHFTQVGGIEKIANANFPILVATNTYPQFFHQKCITFSCNLYRPLI